jgi:hypothetical protein
MSNFNFTLVLYDYIPELVFTLRIWEQIMNKFG